jgi:hypothetical protein
MAAREGGGGEDMGMMEGHCSGGSGEADLEAEILHPNGISNATNAKNGKPEKLKLEIGPSRKRKKKRGSIITTYSFVKPKWADRTNEAIAEQREGGPCGREITCD